MLCDAPVVMDALLRFGLENNPRAHQAMKHILGLVHDNGWPGAASLALGKFRGPGREDDPYLYANLTLLKALSRAARRRLARIANFKKRPFMWSIVGIIIF